MHPHLSSIIDATLRAADPRAALRAHVHRDGDELWVDAQSHALHRADLRLVAVGKAALTMAREMLSILGDITPAAGVVVTKHGAGDGPAGALQVIEAGHPVPDTGSLRAGDAVCAALRAARRQRWSSSASPAAPARCWWRPSRGITLRALSRSTMRFCAAAPISREMNAVRSRIDRLKGGGLVALAQPGRVFGLMLSDVIGDPLDVIASGLTHDPRAVRNILVGNNTQACEAAARGGCALGYAARIVTTELRGEAREAGARIAARSRRRRPAR